MPPQYRAGAANHSPQAGRHALAETPDARAGITIPRMKLLQQLCTTPGVPGREHRVRALIEQHIKGLFDDIRTDPMGSLICTRSARNAAGKPAKSTKRVMVAAHMDQIGFLVKHIDDKGFIRLNPVGGFDTRNLFARMVTICPDPADASKDLPGVLNPAGKPIHIATEEEKKKTPEIHEFVVDTGLSADDVKQRVQIGDMVVLSAPFAEVGHTVVSQCLDNRVACWVAIRAIEKLAKGKQGHAAEIVVVFTVQEEVGLRGARTSAYAVKPDIGIGLDTTLCVDTPGTPDDMAVTRQGQGATITCADGSVINDHDLIRQAQAIAKKHKITHQLSVLPRGGTDTGNIQAAGPGVRTLTLSIGTRYIHTITEMIHKDDLHASVDLLAAFLSEVEI